MNPPWLKAFLIQIGLIALLALASAFPVPSFDDANWDTVMFLTPSAIVSNHLAADPALRSFYSQVSPGQIEIPDWRRLVMALCYLGLAVNVAAQLKRRKPR